LKAIPAEKCREQATSVDHGNEAANKQNIKGKDKK
jgi:hypothetical protein